MKESRELLPPKGGAIFRFFEIPAARPGATEEELRKEAAQQFAAAGASACQVDTSRHPMMHSTPSLDCVILLRGEVTLILDEEEVKLQPFDVVVQRGANHYWVNTSPEPALFAAVLFDAKP
jgi:oxalate decarboxylase/phosphoglucose isomerase-like protein (cupin superfamily)